MNKTILIVALIIQLFAIAISVISLIRQNKNIKELENKTGELENLHKKLKRYE